MAMQNIAAMQNQRDAANPPDWKRVYNRLDHKIFERQAMEDGLVESQVEARKVAFCQFMELAHVTGRSLNPSKAADWAWHVSIVHTGFYRDFCNDLFGHFVDHRPGLKTDNPMKSLQLYNETRCLMEIAYGELDSAVWPDLSSRFTKLELSCCDNTSCMTDCH